MINKVLLAIPFTFASTLAHASLCETLPNHQQLTTALKSVVATTSDETNGGLELNMWGTIVARDGTVCAVAMTGQDYGEQWPGSRAISAQKANTANAFSLPGLALSTANLWTATQPGGSLFGLQFSNPVDTSVAYQGSADNYGTPGDPMVGKRMGGVNVFGGGLALYNKDGQIVGALGVSGDTSCADHNIAWKTRDALGLDYVPGGVSETGDDNIIYTEGHGYAHVSCGNGEVDIALTLPEKYPISK
ncbi:GlcG/HbpS family heme-binding protein [Vibrio sp. WXL210]|uniref:GlcG/HbpS family heme-binding protein n=1 Tax=Vibrio sp. WXL210 TaxID=3450709 RepID=UPI003EC4D691